MTYEKIPSERIALGHIAILPCGCAARVETQTKHQVLFKVVQGECALGHTAGIEASLGKAVEVRRGEDYNFGPNWPDSD